MTVNKVILIGHLGADPETRTTQSGTTVANLRIATNERRKGPDGNWEDHTEWHRVACFGRTAETVARYLRKGRQVYVEGKLRTRKWTDQEGRDRWSTEVIGDNIRFLGGRDSGGGGYDSRSDYGGPPPGAQGGYGGQAPGGQAPGGQGGYGGPGPDDDIPF